MEMILISIIVGGPLNLLQRVQNVRDASEGWSLVSDNFTFLGVSGPSEIDSISDPRILVTDCVSFTSYAK